MLWAFYLLDCAFRVLVGWAGELRSRDEQRTAFPDPQIHDHVAQDCTKLAAFPSPPLPSPPLPHFFNTHTSFQTISWFNRLVV